MEKQFVTFPIAVKLKELGFDKPCLGVFGLYSKEILISEASKGLCNADHELILAPLWQQVIDWLRENYGIDIYPEPTYSLTKYSFKVITVQGKSKRQEYWEGMGKVYNSFEKAREQAILKALELIKKDGMEVLVVKLWRNSYEKI